ncbi:MAG: lipid II:glycine glycyltransferase FemX [Anaerolineales bacterium]
MPIVSLSEWDQYLQSHPNAHLLQTGEWGELKSGFGWEPVRMISGGMGVQILFRKLPLGFTIGYLPKPVISDQLSRISEGFWDEIDSVCKRKHTIFLKLEPDLWEDQKPHTPALSRRAELVEAEAEGWNLELRTSPHNIQPPRTIIINIKNSEEEILARMKQKTRYNIRLAEKKGVTVRPWNDMESFHKMMLVTGDRDRFGIHSLEYYRRAYELFHPTGMCELLVAEYEEKPLAALMVFGHGRRAWYFYGASTDEQRNRMPTYLLQWEAIKWAKARGCEEYDLWGVPDEDEVTLEANFEKRHDGLWGVYRFKRGFGGELRRAAQAVDRVYNPWLYWAYLRLAGNRE